MVVRLNTGWYSKGMAGTVNLATPKPLHAATRYLFKTRLRVNIDYTNNKQ